MFLAGVTLFYIHTLVLIPLILKEGDTRKYLWFMIGCFLVFAVLELVFLCGITKNQTHPDNNIFRINPLHLLQWKQLMKISAAICMQLLFIGILSFIYVLIVYGPKKISPYLELFVHIVILTALFLLTVYVPVKTKDVLAFSIVLLVFYATTFGITPTLIKHQRKLKFAIGLLALCAGFFLLQLLLLESFGVPRFNPETGNRYSREDIPQLIFSTPNSIVLFITLFLSFVYGYLRIRIKAREQSLGLKLGAKESELNLLKSQVNPHFLFNSLNTLYAAALTEKAEKTGESIAKLANLIRYMQEDMNKDFIPLKNEMNYLLDYIAIQKLRCAVTPQIETDFKNIENYYISPGLLIPFVENAFKYGIDPSKPSSLSITANCDHGLIFFSCKNSYDEAFKAYYKEQGFGIGIKNARQRLELVYPKNYTLEIVKENNTFSVKISIRTRNE